MNRFIPTIAALAALTAGTTRAQAPAPSEEVLAITRDSATGAITVSWEARPGRAYFLQHNPTLVSPTDPSVQVPWLYWPDGTLLLRFEIAQTEALVLGSVIGDRSFFRLKSTDAFPTTDPQSGDADGDAYWADGQLKHLFDPLERLRLKQTYDDNGRPFETATPQPNPGGGFSKTTHTYTERGELQTATDPLLHQTTLGYDENGNPRSWQNRRGQTWTFTHNDDNQP